MAGSAIAVLLGMSLMEDPVVKSVAFVVVAIAYAVAVWRLVLEPDERTVLGDRLAQIGRAIGGLGRRRAAKA